MCKDMCVCRNHDGGIPGGTLTAHRGTSSMVISVRILSYQLWSSINGSMCSFRGRFFKLVKFGLSCSLECRFSISPIPSLLWFWLVLSFLCWHLNCSEVFVQSLLVLM